MEQMDPVYLAALQELAKIEGLAKINTVAHFVAAVFGKSFAQVIIDSVNEAPAGVVFAA